MWTVLDRVGGGIGVTPACPGTVDCHNICDYLFVNDSLNDNGTDINHGYQGIDEDWCNYRRQTWFTKYCEQQPLVCPRMDYSALSGLGAPDNPRAQQRAVQYFEQLKASPDGWKLCAKCLTSGEHHNNDHIKFFCFQVLEHYLKTDYINATPTDHEMVKSVLLTWMQMQLRGPDEKFIRNKGAQTFALAFVVDYPRRWSGFFADLLQSLNLGQAVVDMYIRIMMAIDSEVVDREIIHSPQESERNTMIKDTMRVQCVPQLVDSWFQIITSYENTCPELTCDCLEIVGAYVSWIDITLVANDRFVPILLRFMNNPLLRESACDCIHEIISKGMDPLAKTKLIDSFMIVLQNAGVFNITEDEESDYLAKLSKLVNGVGLQLILAWQKLSKGTTEEKNNAKIPFDSMEAKLPLLFRLLGNEDDDVSGAVAKFAHDYITVLKTLPKLSEKQRQSVKELLYVNIKKMKFDECYSFDSEGEEEAMFQEYRKELKVIFNNIGALDGDLVLNTVQELLSQALQNWQTMDFKDVEIAVTLTYMLAEALPHGQYLTADAAKSPALHMIMKMLVTSRISYHQHSSVVMQYFETVVRYEKFFGSEPQYIPDVLMAFLDERGLHNPNQHVSSRTSYLFSRFVKSINKQHMQGYLEEILKRLQDLLVLHCPDNGTNLAVRLSSDDQLFLYETAGILIVQSQFPAEKKKELMSQLLMPIVGKFEGLLQVLMSTQDEVVQVAYAECLNHAMALASRTSKGFSGQQTIKQCGCVEVYTDTLKVFLQVLNAPVQRQLLHTGVRQFLHRMVVCLEEEIMPFVPVAMHRLLESADAKELHDFIPLLNQVVSKFKKRVVPFLQEVFMPVVRTIFHVLSTPVDERDQVAANDKKMLQRGYFSFISTLVNNNVHEVLSCQDMENLEKVLFTVIQGAVDIPDPQGQKACFTILRRLVEVWGDKENGLAGFSDFMYKSIIPACFMAPLKPTFDLGDAQTTLVLNECCACLKSAYEKRGDELILFIQNDYLPGMNVAPELCNEFCQALKAENKIFRNYYKTFFTRGKT